MIIYCDVGNSSIKCFNSEKKEIETKVTSEVNDFAQFNLLTSATKIIFASVVPNKTELLIKFANSRDITLNEIDASKVKLMTITKFDISKMGIDILLNSWYCSEKANSAIVVSFGTATVISVIKEKTLSGYAIMPGLNLSVESLNQNTAKIKNQKFILEKDILGTNTSSAISAGVLHSQIAYIKVLMQENPSAKLFITGGLSMEIKDFFQGTIFTEEMTLQSLAYFFNK